MDTNIYFVVPSGTNFLHFVISDYIVSGASHGGYGGFGDESPDRNEVYGIMDKPDSKGSGVTGTVVGGIILVSNTDGHITIEGKLCAK